MPSADWEDLTEFFDEDEFSDVAIFTNEGDPSFQAVGNFDDAYSQPQLSDYQMDSGKPQFVCPASKVAQVVRGTLCTINSVDYVVRTNEPEGTGLALIVLEHADE